MIHKKAELAIIVGISIVFISAIVMYMLVGRALLSTDESLQVEICRAQLIGAHSVRGGDKSTVFNWALSNVAEDVASNIMSSPLCVTNHREIDLTKVKDSELTKEVGIYIGDMMAKCWKALGEGQIPNTFGQTVENSRNINNYYFPCYRFKILMPKNTDTVLVSDLSKEFDGILWNYNLRGREISSISGLSGDLYNQELKRRYIEYGDEEYLSYAGYITWQNYGSFEFAEKVNEFDVLDDPEYYQFRGSILVLDTKYPLEEIISNQYYEVRYYSAFSTEEIYLNSIKIVPIEEKGFSKPIKGFEQG